MPRPIRTGASIFHLGFRYLAEGGPQADGEGVEFGG
jgi:hypothetical protein